MGVQTESTLEHWLQAYVDEKGGPPRNALEICAFARNRGASLKYREVYDALICSKTVQELGCSPRESHLRSESVGAAGDGQKNATGKEARVRCDSPERQLHPAKLRFSWTLQLGADAGAMKVELLYSRRTGKKQVLIDGKATFKTFQQCFEWSWQHPENEVQIFLHSDHDHHELFCEGSGVSTAERDPRISDANSDSRIEDGTPRRGILATPRGNRSSLATCSATSSTAQSPTEQNPASSSTAKKAEDRNACDFANHSGSTRDLTASCVSPGSSSRWSETPIARSLERNAITSVPDVARRTGQLQCSSPGGLLVSSSQRQREMREDSLASPLATASPRAKLVTPAESFPVLRASSSAPELQIASPPSHYSSPFGSQNAEVQRSPQVPRLQLSLISPRSHAQGIANVEAAPVTLLEASVQTKPETLDSPVVNSQFRQSRSTPIFKKVKEYLIASRASVPYKRTALSGQAPSGAVKKTISTIEAQSPASASSGPAKIVSPTSIVGSAMSPSSPSSSNASRHQAVVEKIQSVAAVVRARLSTSLAPTQGHNVAGVLEPLLEEVSPSSHSHCVANGARFLGNQGRTLARNSSAPGDIRNLEDVQNQAKASGCPSKAVLDSKTFTVPKLQLSEVAQARYEADGGRKSMPSSLQQHNEDGAIQSLAQKFCAQMAQAHPPQQRIPKKARTVQWTPRGNSPTRANMTTPDPGRSATPSHVLTSRHPPLVHLNGIAQTVAASHLRPVRALSPSAQISPTRARLSASSHGFTAGASLARAALRNTQVQPSSSMSVHQPSCVVPQTIHAYVSESSGTRSVGVPPPEYASSQLQGGSFTPPVPNAHARRIDTGYVSTTTPVVQRRVRRSG